MRIVIGWQKSEPSVGDEYIRPEYSGGDMGGYGSRPAGYGIVDPTNIVTPDTPWWQPPAPPAWWSSAQIYTDVVFTPLHGGDVLNLVWPSDGSYPESVTINDRLVSNEMGYPMSGTYEMSLVVDGVRSVNKLFMQCFAYEDGGGYYSSILWSGESADAGGGTTFWTGFRGTEEIVSEGGGNA